MHYRITVLITAIGLTVGLLPAHSQIGGLAAPTRDAPELVPEGRALGNSQTETPEPAAATGEQNEQASAEPETVPEADASLPKVTAVEQDALIMGLRDPFWPIGWEPPPESGPIDSSPKSPIQWAEATKKIKVTALSRTADGDYVAILKGVGLIEKDDVISIQHEGLMYSWQVSEITAAGVKTKQLGVSNIRR